MGGGSRGPSRAQNELHEANLRAMQREEEALRQQRLTLQAGRYGYSLLSAPAGNLVSMTKLFGAGKGGGGLLK